MFSFAISVSTMQISIDFIAMQLLVSNNYRYYDCLISVFMFQSIVDEVFVLFTLVCVGLSNQ